MTVQKWDSWQNKYGSNKNWKGDCWNLGECVPDNAETQASFCCGGDDIESNTTAKRLPNGTLQIFISPDRYGKYNNALIVGYYKKKGASKTIQSCEKYLDETGYDTCCKVASCFRGTCPTWSDGARYALNFNPEAPWVEKFHENNFRDQDSVATQCVKEKKPGDVCEGFNFIKSAWWHDQCPDGYCDAETSKCTKVTACTKDWECGRGKSCYGADESSGVEGTCTERCSGNQGKYYDLGPWKGKDLGKETCPEEKWCEDLICVPRVEVGGKCAGQDACVKTAYCEGETCKAKESQQQVDGASSLLPVFSSCAYALMASFY